MTATPISTATVASIQSIAGTTLTPGTAQTIAVTNGTVNVSATGEVTFTPDANYNGAVSFDYVVSDGNGGTDTGTVSGTITAVNDAPVADDDSFSTNEDTTSAAIDLLDGDTDLDGDTLSIQSIAGTTLTPGTAQTIAVTNGTVNVSATGEVTFTPDANYNGAVSFDYVVSDGNGGTDTGTVSGTITAVNDAPVADDDSFSTNEDTTSAAIDLLDGDTDLDGDTLSIQSIAGTTLTPGTAQTIAVTNGTVNVSATGEVTFTPDANYNGAVSFDYVVSDGNGGTDTGTVSGTITAVNDAPVADDDSFSTNVAQSIAATNGTVNVAANGDISFTPDADHVGDVSFNYTVSDAAGLTDTATVSGTIENVNDAPDAVDDPGLLDGTEDTPSGVLNTDMLNNDLDPDLGDTLTITAINGTALTPGVAQSIAATNGTVNVAANGDISFTPDADHVGDVSFNYTVSDAAGLTDTATVSGTIENVNDAPDAVDDPGLLDGTEDTPSGVLNTDMLNNDLDPDLGDTLTITAINGTALTPGVAQSIAATNGTVNVAANGDISFTPDADHVGDVSFNYTVSDAAGLTDTATVSGTIENVNDAPDAVDDPGLLDGTEDTPSGVLNTDMLNNDLDPDLGDTLTITAINGTALTPGVAQSIAATNGTVNVAANGDISFTPDADHVGDVSFNYTVSDAAGLTDTATVSGTIENVNDAPDAVDDPGLLDGTEDTPSGVLNTDMLNNDLDPDLGDTLTITAINGTALTPGVAQSIAATNGTVNVAANGDISFTPDADHVGDVSFNYTVSDAAGLTDTATVSGTIENVNDAPDAVDDPGLLDGTEDTPTGALNTILLKQRPGPGSGDTLTITAIDGTALTAAWRRASRSPTAR